MYIKNYKNNQRGVGLIEVLVSMVILSVAVLGFVALQIGATNATGEALKRSDALIILSGLAEKIRLNPTGGYKVTIPDNAPSCDVDNQCTPDEQALIDLYIQSEYAQSKMIQLGVSNCPNTSANQPRLCLLAAWETTEPTVAQASTNSSSTPDANEAEGATAPDGDESDSGGDSQDSETTTSEVNDTNVCLSATGRYADDSHCLVLEAY